MCPVVGGPGIGALVGFGKLGNCRSEGQHQNIATITVADSAQFRDNNYQLNRVLVVVMMKSLACWSVGFFDTRPVLRLVLQRLCPYSWSGYRGRTVSRHHKYASQLPTLVAFFWPPADSISFPFFSFPSSHLVACSRLYNLKFLLLDDFTPYAIPRCHGASAN